MSPPAPSGQPPQARAKATAAPGARLGVQVIARAAAILRALAGKDDGLSLAQLAAQTGLPRSTVQRIVAALDHENLVIAASLAARVRLGPGLVSLAQSVRFEIAEFARPFLREIARQTGGTAHLALLDGAKGVYVARAADTRYEPAPNAQDESFPLPFTAGGKALLAALPPAELRRIRTLLHLPRGKWPRLEAELIGIRAAGVAIDRGEYAPGTASIATAVTGPRGELAAISVSVPSSRFPAIENTAALALRRASTRLQGLLSSRETEPEANSHLAT
jgi:IclR family transcriptional regulator, acetate operon repressor